MEHDSKLSLSSGNASRSPVFEVSELLQVSTQLHLLRLLPSLPSMAGVSGFPVSSEPGRDHLVVPLCMW